MKLHSILVPEGTIFYHYAKDLGLLSVYTRANGCVDLIAQISVVCEKASIYDCIMKNYRSGFFFFVGCHDD